MIETLKPPRPSAGTKGARNRTFNEVRSVFDFLFKSVGLIVWFVVLVLALLEIKRYYNIDLIPGYDSAVDDVYGAARGTLSDWFK